MREHQTGYTGQPIMESIGLMRVCPVIVLPPLQSAEIIFSPELMVTVYFFPPIPEQAGVNE